MTFCTRQLLISPISSSFSERLETPTAGVYKR
jgi:hypothetical protein